MTSFQVGDDLIKVLVIELGGPQQDVAHGFQQWARLVSARQDTQAVQVMFTI